MNRRRLSQRPGRGMVPGATTRGRRGAARRTGAARKALFAALLPLLPLLLGTAGCGPSGTGGARPLRIGISPWPGYEFLYLAQEKGLFTEAGAAVRLVEYGSLEDEMRGFARGQIDGAACTLVELLQMPEECPRGLQVVLVLDSSNGPDVILARSPIGSVRDLRGRRIALEPHTLNFYILARALERAGLGLDDVNIVPTNQASMVSLLAGGAVDAVVTFPPISQSIRRVIPVNQVFSTADIPGEILDVLALDTEILSRRAPEAARIRLAWQKARDYASSHPDEAIALMAAREHVSPEEFQDSLVGLRLMTAAEQAALLAPGGAVERVLERVDGVMRRLGRIQGPDRTSTCLAFAARARREE